MVSCVVQRILGAFLVALEKIGGERILRDRTALGRHQAVELLRAHRLEILRRNILRAVADHEFLDSGSVEPADDPHAVIEGRGVDKNNIGIGVANGERDRNGVGERRRLYPIEHDLHVALRQRLIQALEVSDARAGVVTDQRRGLD